MSAILVGGTPGTGKTKIAKMLGTRLSVNVVELGELAERAGCITAQDKARDTGIIDEDCLATAIQQEVADMTRQLVIVGHYIDLVPYSAVDHVFILRTHPETLRHRLIARGWPEEKIGEVSNFFVKPMVAAIRLSATLNVGDTIHVKGHSTDVTLEVASMQIDRNAVESADAGSEVGIKMPERARSGDEVFKVVD